MLIIAGCASSIIAYEPSKRLNIKDASDTVEELIMTQHPNWKPDYVETNPNYISWGYGIISKGQGSTVAYNNIAFGSSTTRTRDVGERIYFKSIKDVQLISWQRKFKEWYVVSIIGKDDDIKKHVLYTRDINEAKRFIDAFNSLMVAYKNK